jgi:hypothetical protein
MKTMNYEEMESMFKVWISESIKSLGSDTEGITNYYGNAEECTMESYFSSYMNEDGIYNGDIDPENILIPSSDFELAREAFESARDEAYQDYIDEKEDEE